MKQFKKSLLIIGLCFLMIGCTNDAMGKVTKKLQDAGYDISYLTDDFTAVNINKTEKDKDRILCLFRKEGCYFYFIYCLTCR